MGRKRLVRSNDRWFAGVCGGIAEFVGWEANVVRMLWILATLLSAGIGGLIAYTIMALVMPPPSGKAS